MRNRLAFGHKISLCSEDARPGVHLRASNNLLYPVGLPPATDGQSELQFENAVFQVLSGYGDVSSDLTSRRFGEEITFGQTVRLLHVGSNSLLCVHRHARAAHEKSHNKVTLEKFASPEVKNSRWRILPRYKVRSEGQKVCDRDVIILQSASGDVYLHVAASTNTVASAASMQASPRNNNENNNNNNVPSPEKLPASSAQAFQMNEESWLECNAGPTLSGFFLTFYDTETHVVDALDFNIRCGDCLQFFHKEHSALLGNELVDPKPYLEVTDAETDGSGGGLDDFDLSGGGSGASGGGAGGSRKKNDFNASSFDATFSTSNASGQQDYVLDPDAVGNIEGIVGHAKVFPSTSLFVVEQEDIFSGGPVVFGRRKMYRLKNLSTGLFLCVKPVEPQMQLPLDPLRPGNLFGSANDQSVSGGQHFEEGQNDDDDDNNNNNKTPQKEEDNDPTSLGNQPSHALATQSNFDASNALALTQTLPTKNNNNNNEQKQAPTGLFGVSNMLLFPIKNDHFEVSVSEDPNDPGCFICFHQAGDDSSPTARHHSRVYFEFPLLCDGAGLWLSSETIAEGLANAGAASSGSGDYGFGGSSLFGSFAASISSSYTSFAKPKQKIRLAITSGVSTKDGVEIRKVPYKEFQELNSVVALMPPLQNLFDDLAEASSFFASFRMDPSSPLSEQRNQSEAQIIDGLREKKKTAPFLHLLQHVRDNLSTMITMITPESHEKNPLVREGAIDRNAQQRLVDQRVVFLSMDLIERLAVLGNIQEKKGDKNAAKKKKDEHGESGDAVPDNNNNNNNERAQSQDHHQPSDLKQQSSFDRATTQESDVVQKGDLKTEDTYSLPHQMPSAVYGNSMNPDPSTDTFSRENSSAPVPLSEVHDRENFHNNLTIDPSKLDKSYRRRSEVILAHQVNAVIFHIIQLGFRLIRQCAFANESVSSQMRELIPRILIFCSAPKKKIGATDALVQIFKDHVSLVDTPDDVSTINSVLTLVKAQLRSSTAAVNLLSVLCFCDNKGIRTTQNVVGQRLLIPALEKLPSIKRTVENIEQDYLNMSLKQSKKYGEEQKKMAKEGMFTGYSSGPGQHVERGIPNEDSNNNNTTAGEQDLKENQQQQKMVTEDGVEIIIVNGRKAMVTPAGLIYQNSAEFNPEANANNSSNVFSPKEQKDAVFEAKRPPVFFYLWQVRGEVFIDVTFDDVPQQYSHMKASASGIYGTTGNDGAKTPSAGGKKLTPASSKERFSPAAKDEGRPFPTADQAKQQEDEFFKDNDSDNDGDLLGLGSKSSPGKIEKFNSQNFDDFSNNLHSGTSGEQRQHLTLEEFFEFYNAEALGKAGGGGGGSSTDASSRASSMMSNMTAMDTFFNKKLLSSEITAPAALLYQLRLISSLCADRHDENIRMVRILYPFELLDAMCRNPLFPGEIRAATLNIIQHAYVDVPPLPDLIASAENPVFLWEDVVSKNKGKLHRPNAPTLKKNGGLSRKARIANLFVDSDDDVEFDPAENEPKLMTKRERTEFKRYRETSTGKGILNLVKYVQEYVESQSKMQILNRDENSCVEASLCLVKAFIRFGWIEAEGYKVWLNGLSQVLDGKIDEGPEKWDRYHYDERNHVIMSVKMLSIDCISMIATIIRTGLVQVTVSHFELGKPPPHFCAILDLRPKSLIHQRSLDFERIRKNRDARAKFVSENAPNELFEQLINLGTGAAGIISTLADKLTSSNNPMLDFTYLEHLFEVLLDCCCYKYDKLIRRSMCLYLELTNLHYAIHPTLRQLQLLTSSSNEAFYNEMRKLHVKVRSFRSSQISISDLGHIRKYAKMMFKALKETAEFEENGLVTVAFERYNILYNMDFHMIVGSILCKCAALVPPAFGGVLITETKDGGLEGVSPVLESCINLGCEFLNKFLSHSRLTAKLASDLAGFIRQLTQFLSIMPDHFSPILRKIFALQFDVCRNVTEESIENLVVAVSTFPSKPELAHLLRLLVYQASAMDQGDGLIVRNQRMQNKLINVLQHSPLIETLVRPRGFFTHRKGIANITNLLNNQDYLKDESEMVMRLELLLTVVNCARNRAADQRVAARHIIFGSHVLSSIESITPMLDMNPAVGTVFCTILNQLFIEDRGILGVLCDSKPALEKVLQKFTTILSVFANNVNQAALGGETSFRMDSMQRSESSGATNQKKKASSFHPDTFGGRSNSNDATTDAHHGKDHHHHDNDGFDDFDEFDFDKIRTEQSRRAMAESFEVHCYHAILCVIPCVNTIIHYLIIEREDREGTAFGLCMSILEMAADLLDVILQKYPVTKRTFTLDMKRKIIVARRRAMKKSRMKIAAAAKSGEHGGAAVEHHEGDDGDHHGTGSNAAGGGGAGGGSNGSGGDANAGNNDGNNNNAGSSGGGGPGGAYLVNDDDDDLLSISSVELAKLQAEVEEDRNQKDRDLRYGLLSSPTSGGGALKLDLSDAGGARTNSDTNSTVSLSPLEKKHAAIKGLLSEIPEHVYIAGDVAYDLRIPSSFYFEESPHIDTFPAITRIEHMPLICLRELADLLEVGLRARMSADSHEAVDKINRVRSIRLEEDFNETFGNYLSEGGAGDSSSSDEDAGVGQQDNNNNNNNSADNSTLPSPQKSSTMGNINSASATKDSPFLVRKYGASLQDRWEKFVSRFERCASGLREESQFRTPARLALLSGKLGHDMIESVVRTIESPEVTMHDRSMFLAFLRQVIIIKNEDASDAAIILPRMSSKFSDDDEADPTAWQKRKKTLSIDKTIEERQTILATWKDGALLPPKLVRLVNTKNIGMTRAALNCGIALMDGGNNTVQRSLMSYFLSTNRETFFAVCRTFLVRARDSIQERQALIEDETIDQNLSSPTFEVIQEVSAQFDFSVVKLLLKFVQQFCEGHYNAAQNYLRIQEDNQVSINVLDPMMALLETLVVSGIDFALYDLTIQLLSTLAEAIQGPCLGNTRYVISQNAGGLITRILSDSHAFLSDDDKFSLSRAAMSLLLSLLEGHTNKPMILMLLQSITTDVLVSKMDDCYDKWAETNVSGIQRFASTVVGQKNSESRIGMFITEVCDEIVGFFLGLFYPPKAQDEFNDTLNLACSIFIFMKSVLDIENLLICNAGLDPNDEINFQFKDREERTMVRAFRESKYFREMSKIVATIEILRNGKVERCYFRVPSFCRRNLQEETKKRLIDEVDRSGDGARLTSYFERCFNLMKEIDLYEQMRQTRGLSLVNKYAPIAENLALLFAFVQNFILIIFAEFAYETDSSAHLPDGGPSIAFTFFGFSLMILQSVLFLNFWNGELKVFLYEAFQEWQEDLNHEAIRESKQNLNIIPAKIENDRYSQLSFIEKIFWNIYFTLSYAPMYKYILFCALSYLGFFVAPYWYCIQPLQIIWKSPQLYNVVESIIKNKWSLFLTFILLLVCVNIFTVIAYFIFSEMFDEGQTGFAGNCDTMSRCFTTTLLYGLKAGGGIGDDSNTPIFTLPDPSRYFGRIIYDLLFFVIMIILFLNLVFGIILDTFSQLREGREGIEEDQEIKCFICGISRDELDKVTPGGFDQHITFEHNMWNYLFFMMYCRGVDPNDHTGQEGYVWHAMEAHDPRWFPVGRALAVDFAPRETGGMHETMEVKLDDDNSGVKMNDPLHHQQQHPQGAVSSPAAGFNRNVASGLGDGGAWNQLPGHQQQQQQNQEQNSMHLVVEQDADQQQHPSGAFMMNNNHHNSSNNNLGGSHRATPAVGSLHPTLSRNNLSQLDLRSLNVVSDPQQQQVHSPHPLSQNLSFNLRNQHSGAMSANNNDANNNNNNQQQTAVLQKMEKLEEKNRDLVHQLTKMENLIQMVLQNQNREQQQQKKQE